MTVVFLTGGSRGDVEPYVALGAGLRRAGCRVRVATHDGFRELVESHGLEFAHVAAPTPDLIDDPRWDELARDADSGFRYAARLRRLRSALEPVVQAMLDDHWVACRGATAVVSSLSAFAGADQAAALGVPHCWALLQPVTPTRAYPHFATPPWLRLPARLNPLTYRVADAIADRVLHPAVRSWLRRVLGTPRRLGVAPPIVYGISPTVVPPPRDRPRGIAQFGSWGLTDGGPLDARTEDFLDARPRPPIFVHGEAIGDGQAAAALVDAVRRHGLRAVVSGVPPELGDDELLPVGAMPFPRLFERVAAVVHHGGAATTTCALRAGVPAFGVPGSFDQSFWSCRGAALGAGPPPVPVRRVGTRRIDVALDRLMSTHRYRTRARELAAGIRREHGVEDTVAHLARVLGLNASAGRL